MPQKGSAVVQTLFYFFLFARAPSVSGCAHMNAALPQRLHQADKRHSSFAARTQTILRTDWSDLSLNARTSAT